MDAPLFRRWMTMTLDVAVVPPSPARRREAMALIDGIAGLAASSPGFLAQVPGLIREVLGGRGYAWNGFYVRHGETLRLAAAAGPPVCAELEPRGGLHASGMCWDAVLMNQTLVAADTKAWPGYVSCDGESGLATASGVVCPLRDPTGAVVGVWDVDVTQSLDAFDGPFFDRMFATLSVLAPDAVARLVASAEGG